ncbi:hypothetical protein ACHAXT_007149 [Thalassiosira profunda]
MPADPSTATQRRPAGAPPSAGAATPPPSSGVPSRSSGSAMMLPIRVLSKLPTLVTILLRVLLWPLIKVAGAAFPPREFDGINNAPASDRAARAFVATFQKHISAVRPMILQGNNGEGQEHYVEPACPFSPRGYLATLNDITSRPPNARPLFLVCLHSPLHADGAKFINEYLCHPQLLQLLNSYNEGSVVCFGTSVHAADGQKLRDMLGVTGFPFVALLSVKGTSNNSRGSNDRVSMELLLRMEGTKLMTIPPAQITTYLNTAITRHAEALALEEARRLQREEDARLREEQNREYQETLLADQMREIERQEAAEQGRREQEAREEEERLKKAKEESRLEDARATLENAGGEPSAGPGTARLRFTLPNGKKVDRRFRSADTIDTLRAFLTVHFDEQGIEIKNFSLSTNYPKKTFGEEDDGATLEEAGLGAGGVLMVQDLDS